MPPDSCCIYETPPQAGKELLSFSILLEMDM